MKPRPIACDYDGTLWWIDDPPKIGKFSGPVACLELGLRWLHDRAFETYYYPDGRKRGGGKDYWSGYFADHQ